MKKTQIYSKAIYQAFHNLLKNRKDVVILGQGLWSPWYVGSTMNDLEKKFGKDRVIDTPVSEAAVTGMAIGASLFKLRPIVVHPRMDFMLLATDSIINEATKWKYILGGTSNVKITIRSIINRGGEQGAQHSQSLYSMFANIPGIDVLLPSNPQDAYDMLVGSVLSDRPSMYIDDKWLYNEIGIFKKNKINKNFIKNIKPKTLIKGKDLTIVTLSYGVKFSKELIKELKLKKKISIELIDLRKINDIKDAVIIKSVKKTKRLVVIDFGWKNCSISGEIISRCSEKLSNKTTFSSMRYTLPDTPAPTNKLLEKNYYLDSKKIAQDIIRNIFK
jgi:pyruvate dehydrogenase E1 component beta subunit